MTRRPPRSTLFPHTTLSRPRRRPPPPRPRRWTLSARRASCVYRTAIAPPLYFRHESSLEHRSEEHTSELQSRQYLVCRLLLEKKKDTMRRFSVEKGII